ncbi:unnamed protein product [Urochloa humidicola]
MHDSMRRKQTAKEDQFSTMQPHPGRIPNHGGGDTGSDSKQANHYNYKQQQLPRLPGAPLLAPLADMSPTEASASPGDGSASSSSWVKPGCMMELARLAKIPQPASGLMCPRCRSTETKFCYYNNYSLAQPRHFCKTCRRYWTHGGTLRDLPFSSSIRRRRGRNKSSSNDNKHTSSKLACCGGASGAGRASSSSSSGGGTVPGGRVAAAAAVVKPLEQLLGGTERQRTGASRLWFPGHSSQQDPVPLGYHHLGNSIRLQYQCYHPQRQPFSFLGYRNGAGASAAGPSAICPFSAGASGPEAACFTGQMGSAALMTTELSSEMMVETNPPTEMPGTTLTTTSSPGEFMMGLQVENDLFHFLGSSSSWPACGGYGSISAGNGSGGGGTAAPSNAWPDASPRRVLAGQEYHTVTQHMHPAGMADAAKGSLYLA